MKTRIFSLILFWAFVFSSASAQKATYVAAEVGPRYVIYENTDFGGKLKTPAALYSSTQSVHFGKEIIDNILVEVGFGYHEHGSRYGIQGLFFSNISIPEFEMIELPIRLKAEAEILPDWVSLTTTIGYTFGIQTSGGNQTNGNPDNSGSVLAGGFGRVDSIGTSYASYHVSDGKFGMIETGISIDFKCNKKWQIYLAGNYKIGLERLVETDVRYRINAEPERFERFISNGSYFSLRAGVRYDISKLFRKKE